jgi:hypothetical protein
MMEELKPYVQQISMDDNGRYIATATLQHEAIAVSD